MEHIAKADIVAASQELPGSRRPVLQHYIERHLTRLESANPHLGELIRLISRRTINVHDQVLVRTPEELSEYISSLILLVVRTIEIAETRASTEHTDDIDNTPLDPNVLAGELFAKLSRPK